MEFLLLKNKVELDFGGSKLCLQVKKKIQNPALK